MTVIRPGGKIEEYRSLVFDDSSPLGSNVSTAPSDQYLTDAMPKAPDSGNPTQIRNPYGNKPDFKG